LDQFNFSQAGNILQNISSQFELNIRQTEIHERCLTFVNLLPQLLIDSLGFQLPDSVQTVVLEQIAAEGSTFSGAWARNILIASGLLTYQEPVVFESNNKSSDKAHFHFLNTHENESDFIIFPNPAKDYCIIAIKKLVKINSATLLIYNLQGQHIGSYSLSIQTTQQLFPLQNFPKGTYLFQILIDGASKTIQKVVVLH
jgi:hypothetical protein